MELIATGALIAVLVILFLIFGGSIAGIFASVSAVITATFAGALLVGALWFYVLLLGGSCWIIYLINEDITYAEKYGWERWNGWRTSPFVIVAVALLLLQFFGDIRVFSYINEHRILSGLWAVAYICIGIVHSIFREFWYQHVTRKALFHDRKRAFFHDYSIENDTIPPRLADSWQDMVDRYTGKRPAHGHMGQIMSWMAYWPWSFFWFIVSDFIKKLYRHIYNLLEGVFERIAESAWKSMQSEVEKITVQKREKKNGVSENPRGQGDTIE